MTAPKRTLLIALLTLSLVSCTSQSSVSDVEVNAARSGTRWAVILGTATSQAVKQRPAALLGTYVAEFLMQSSTYESALAGIEAQMYILFSNEEQDENDAYALLEELGIILQVDIADMLNRSTDRPQAFDAYVAGLTNIGQQAQSELELLEQELETIQDERREKRKIASEIQSDLNQALREQDYSSASELQQQIIEAEAEVTRIESAEDEQKSIIKLYKDLLEVAGERLTAMNENREALLEGVTIVDVPGITDLKLIEQGEGGRRGDSIFEL